MTDKLQAIRGMADILPQESVYWQRVESVCREVVAIYGYHEIRFPIVEQTRLFKRSIGEVTDIVEKEMYTFEDRNGDSLTLRPEGTAGCVRAGIEHGLLYHQIQRLWYSGPMFRHERPQKGRQREFHQLGVEAFGIQHPGIDLEMILLSKRILDRLGLTDWITLEINNLGDFEQRARYKIALVEYLSKHKAQLDEDSLKRLSSNPLRILDSKNPDMQTIIAGAPSMQDFIEGQSKAHFDQLCQWLTALGISYRLNPHLVRGLVYYCLTVFEWVTTHLGAQGTVCAGGRYDGLVAQLGGKESPAVGFAMGSERMVLLLQEKQKLQDTPDYYVIATDTAQIDVVIMLIEKIRTQSPSVKMIMDFGESNVSSKFKRADKSGAQFALVIGENELKQEKVTVKNLKTGEQALVATEEL